MSKLRSLNTAFWSDPFVEELKPDEKLLFLYLIMNEKTNMLGIYESTLRKMSFETGIEMNRCQTILNGFEGLGKVRYMNNWVLLVNFMKHQNYNPNMKKSAIDCYNNLPDNLKIKGLKLNRETPDEAFETLSKAYQTVRKEEVEYEGEIEEEIETEKEADLHPDGVCEKNEDGVSVREEKNMSGADHENSDRPDSEKPGKPEGEKPNPKFNFKKAMIDYGFEKDLVQEFMDIRKKKGAVNSDLAFKRFISDIEESGFEKNAVLDLICKRQWKGFELSWLDDKMKAGLQNNTASPKNFPPPPKVLYNYKDYETSWDEYCKKYPGHPYEKLPNPYEQEYKSPFGI